MFASILNPRIKPVKDLEPNTITALPSTCSGCLWARGGGVTCDAFPEGIPLPIMVGAFDHHYHYEDEVVSDEGLTFTPMG